MNLVSIDFVAGSHGQFLEYVCNRFIAQHSIDYLPFNNIGASHLKMRNKNFNFIANHFSLFNLPKQKRIIKITFCADDLLLLTSGGYLRAGDSNIDVRFLEIDTFNKLNNGIFNKEIENINSAYKTHVKLTALNPDCPRNILREYFKFSFMNPEKHGLMQELYKLIYDTQDDVIEFKFDTFYNTEKFIQAIDSLAIWYNKPVNLSGLEDLHKIFLSKQIFKDDKKRCDYILHCITTKQSELIESLSVLQESYINANLENLYHIEMPFLREKYFNSTMDIVQYLNV